MVHVGDRWHMFFEVMNGRTGRGEIGSAISEDARRWTYRKIVLAEPFHLSYPYVFEWMHEYYMIPECHQTKTIRLYKAEPFPERWSFVATLISGRSFMDASVFFRNQHWWLFTETNPDYRCDTLRLYHAPELTGPWQEHPRSPLIEGNPHIARPAGRVLTLSDRVLRFAQDCVPSYGTKVRALEIMRLTAGEYCEREIDASPILTPSGNGWNGSGMHHIDAHALPSGGWLACVDGWVRRQVP
jgi:hypothetical protein